MTRHGLAIAGLVCGASLSLAAQTPSFSVQKYDIKGDGGTNYITVEPATGRVFVSRGTHMMVVDGATGKVIADIPNTPGVHGAGLATKAGHGFTTNSGDGTVTMFDLKTLAVLKQIKAGDGLDGIMFDEPDDKIILTNHSKPGTLTAINPVTGDIVATVTLEDEDPEGAAADGKGHLFVNNEGTSTIQEIDTKTWKPIASWKLAPCEGTVTVVRQDGPDKYSTVATVNTFPGAKTITVDPNTHRVYLFQPERGPAPAGAAAPAPPASGRRGRGPQGPVIASWFIVISS